MTDFQALYRELDPLEPVAADDQLVYVDWQRQLDPVGGDVKSLLVREFVRDASPERPIVRLLTGHKGSGKTTELNRVSARLRSGGAGRKIFVSTLFAQNWLDLEDIQPEDLVLQTVRQLVADLSDTGIDLGRQQLKTFLGSIWDRLKGTQLDKVDVGLDPLKFSFALESFPTARKEFREVLRGRLPTVFDLVNGELLPAARRQLRESHGYEDVLLIVDDLDKIPQKVVAGARLTNHENLFLDNAATLRAISCSKLLTVPIELAYSPAQGRLRDDYGASLFTVPLVPIAQRDGRPIEAGEAALIEILGRRVQRALADAPADPATCAGTLFDGRELLLRVVRLSGGHVRGLLVMMRGLLNMVDELPIGAATVDRYVGRTGKDLGRALFAADREILRQVAATKEATEDSRFFDLLRNQYVFAYEGEEYWYGLNPLLGEIAP
ncbi:MAG: hypothetical protein ABR569_13780 [Gaiellaceae bacterium]